MEYRVGYIYTKIHQLKNIIQNIPTCVSWVVESLSSLAKIGVNNIFLLHFFEPYNLIGDSCK